MSELETRLNNIAIAKGMIHLSRLAALRIYLKQVPDNDIILAINKITNLTLLRILWEAGLNATLQTAVLRRTDELIQRREGVTP